MCRFTLIMATMIALISLQFIDCNADADKLQPRGKRASKRTVYTVGDGRVDGDYLVKNGTFKNPECHNRVRRNYCDFKYSSSKLEEPRNVSYVEIVVDQPEEYPPNEWSIAGGIGQEFIHFFFYVKYEYVVKYEIYAHRKEKSNGTEVFCLEFGSRSTGGSIVANNRRYHIFENTSSTALWFYYPSENNWEILPEEEISLIEITVELTANKGAFKPSAEAEIKNGGIGKKYVELLVKVDAAVSYVTETKIYMVNRSASSASAPCTNVAVILLSIFCAFLFNWI